MDRRQRSRKYSVRPRIGDGTRGQRNDVRELSVVSLGRARADCRGAGGRGRLALPAVPAELDRSAACHGGRLLGVLREAVSVLSASPADANPFGSTKTDSPTRLAPRRATNEEIARRAFEIYCEHACRDGHDLDDWLRAERECNEACAVPIRLRIKPDRRVQRGPRPVPDRRRSTA